MLTNARTLSPRQTRFWLSWDEDHLYVAMRTPIVDVLVGRYYSLFGWGGKGLLPNTAAFMGTAGQVYDLETQVRLSHIFRFEFVDFEIAGHAGRFSSPPCRCRRVPRTPRASHRPVGRSFLKGRGRSRLLVALFGSSPSWCGRTEVGVGVRARA